MIWIAGLELFALALIWYFLVHRDAVRRKRRDAAAPADEGTGRAGKDG